MAKRYKFNIVEKAITNPNKICICPKRTQLISNGSTIIPLNIRDYLPYCPAHKDKAHLKGF